MRLNKFNGIKMFIMHKEWEKSWQKSLQQNIKLCNDGLKSRIQRKPKKNSEKGTTSESNRRLNKWVINITVGLKAIQVLQYLRLLSKWGQPSVSKREVICNAMVITYLRIAYTYSLTDMWSEVI